MDYLDCFVSSVSAMLVSTVTLMPTFLIYTLLLMMALYIRFRWTNRRLLSIAAKLPQVNIKAWPIIGHSYVTLRGREGLTHAVLRMSQNILDRGIKTSCLWCGPLPIIAIHDLEDIQTILNSSYSLDKSDEYDFFRFGLDLGDDVVKYCIITAPGKIWKTTRKHMNPLLHPRNLDLLIPVFNRNSEELVACLSEHEGQGAFDLMPHTMDTALKTVCNLIFGLQFEFDIKSPELQGLKFFVEKIPDLFISRLLHPWLRIDSLFTFIYRKEIKQLNLLFKNFTEKPLQIIKDHHKKKGLIEETVEGKSKSLPGSDFQQNDEPLNILDMFSNLQRSNPEFTETDLKFEMVALYCTGTDTVGSGVASCLLALAQYQDIQERLYKEISSTIGKEDDVTIQDLNKMPFLEQVVKETLRWFTLVPYVMRKSSKDINFSTCTVPAGNSIIVSLVGIHMDPQLYPDPHRFDPDRFSPDRTVDSGRSFFIPFSGGPRNCIAKLYAMQLMKIMIVHVLRKYRVSTKMDITKLKRVLKVTLLSAEGYVISLEPRNKSAE